jgi:DNA-binding NarL/FixJ family response regulator
MTPEADSQKSRVFIVDDHPLVREWLAALINQQPDLMVCGEAGSASECLDLILAANPHVAVVDISMEGGSGIELIKNIKAACPDVVVTVLSVHDELNYAERALRAGARGYTMKREATANVLQAIRSVLKGELRVSEKIAAIIAGKYAGGNPMAANSAAELLSDRELEVFELLGRGCATRKIASEMHISFRTVQAFCARIKEKLNLASATELLHEAMRWHDSQQKG